jgi:hypothetical protein
MLLRTAAAPHFCGFGGSEPIILLGAAWIESVF